MCCREYKPYRICNCMPLREPLCDELTQESIPMFVCVSSPNENCTLQLPWCKTTYTDLGHENVCDEEM